MAFIYQIVLLAFFLAFARLSARDIKSGIYAVLFLLPLYLLRFSIADIPTTVLEIMIYILSAVWFLQNGKSFDIAKSVRKFYECDKALSIGITLLFLGVVLSTLHSSDMRTSLGVLKGWFADPFLFFLIFTSEIKNKKQSNDALMGFILSGFVVAVVGMGYALNNIFTFDGRLRAFYESPNYLAMYLSPAFLFAVYLFIFEKSHGEDSPFVSVKERLDSLHQERYQIFFIRILKGLSSSKSAQAIVLLLLAVVILLTKSYGAVLGIAAALFCSLLKKHSGKNKRLFSDNKKSLMILAVTTFAVFSFFSFQKYEQIVNSSERSSLHSRLMIWSASIEMIKDSPFFGIGPGTFQKTYLDYQSRFSVPYLEWAVPEPHNTFLAFSLQSGLLGLIGLILILFWLFKKARRSDIVFLFLVYFLIHGSIDTLYWKNDLALIFYLVAGIGFLDKGGSEE